jgi:hypothetical protein
MVDECTEGELQMQPVESNRSLRIAFMNFPSVIGALVLFLFILSGRFTTDRIGLEGVEVRQIMAIVALLWAGGRFASARGIMRGTATSVFMWSVIFIFCMAFTGFWSISDGLAEKKLIDALILLIMIVSVYLVFSRDPGAIIWFLALMAAAGMLYSLLVFLSIGTGEQARGSTGISGPNVATRVMFIGMLSLMFLSSYFKKQMLLWPIPLYLAGIVGVGSRGGVVAAALSVGLLLFLFFVFSNKEMKLSTNSTKAIGKYAILACVGGVLFYYYLLPVVEGVFRARVVNLLFERLHYAGRDDIYLASWEAIGKNLFFGLGLGGYTSIGINPYPHNLFLELLLDGGIFLVLAFVPIALMSFFVLLKSRGKTLLLSIICTYMLMVQMVSGDYYDFRYFFVFLIISSITVSHYKNMLGGAK